MKYIIGFTFFILSGYAQAAEQWTGWRTIGDIYTYNNVETLYVFLDGIECPNTKKHFAIDPSQVGNANQLISMILAARMAKVNVDVYYDPDLSTSLCYMKGLKIQN